MLALTRDGFADNTFRAIAKNALTPPVALRAFLKAHRLLGLALGAELAERRSATEPLQRVHAEAKLNDLLLRGFQEAVAILGEHIDKLHESRRPHYSPGHRFRILKLKSLLGLSQLETARLFRLSSATVARWEGELRRDPERTSIGALIQATPPVRRIADVVRHLVQSMAASGFGGNRRIAQTLARAGWELSRETVRRIRREERPSVPPPDETQALSAPSVIARRPNHVWMLDLTVIPSRFRLFRFKLVAVLDVFSRYPLVWKTFWLEPSSRDIRSLMNRAIRLVGPPRHLVTDSGAQFTSRSFRRWVRRRGIGHRFGAIGKTGSIAVIERFWRTLKELLGLPFQPPLLKAELDRRLLAALTYYAELKPHYSLRGDTPAEGFFGRRSLPLTDRPPPQARPGERNATAPFHIEHFRGDPRLPSLVST